MSESKLIHNSHNVSDIVFHFVSSIGKHTSEKVVGEYVRNQGKENGYKQLFLNV